MFIYWISLQLNGYIFLLSLDFERVHEIMFFQRWAVKILLIEQKYGEMKD